MKTASLAELKKELNTLPEKELSALCVRLAGYKKENRELLNYLLFEAHDEEAYVEKVKEEVSAVFKEINTTSQYLAKKTIRRILRILNKYIRYSGNKQTEVELLFFFFEELKTIKLPVHENKVLVNLCKRQLNTMDKALASLHEDLQFDYSQKIASLDVWRDRLLQV